jgi:hypothetical protein
MMVTQEMYSRLEDVRETVTVTETVKEISFVYNEMTTKRFLGAEVLQLLGWTTVQIRRTDPIA